MKGWDGIGIGIGMGQKVDMTDTNATVQNATGHSAAA